MLFFQFEAMDEDYEEDRGWDQDIGDGDVSMTTQLFNISAPLPFTCVLWSVILWV